MKPNIVGLTGYLGSGKTTAAMMLEEHLAYKRIPFAAPLKAMLAAAGIPAVNLVGNPKDKEEPLPMLGGHSARHAMQTLGTEWGRNLIHPDLWTILWKNKASGYDFVVVDDLRFPNEADLVRRMNGVVIRIDRPGNESGDHSSEKMIDNIVADAIVGNDASEMDLYFRVLSIVNERYHS